MAMQQRMLLQTSVYVKTKWYQYAHVPKKVCTCFLYIQVHALLYICTFSYVRVVKPAWCDFAAMSL